MMGSGTTLVTARIRGYEAVGLDRDPLAVLIASASIGDLDHDAFIAEAATVLAQARRLARRLTPEQCYPMDADEETKRFLRKWFDIRARRELTSLISALKRGHFATTPFLRCAISRMIITKQRGVSRAWDVSHSRPHIKYRVAPVSPFDFFLQNVAAICRHHNFKKRSGLPQGRVRSGDCRHLPFESASFDYIITSPPYLNAIDYLRGHKLSLVWFGYSVAHIRLLRSTNVGSECGIQDTGWDNTMVRLLSDCDRVSSRLLGMARRYACDLGKTMSEIRRVSKAGARITLVVGDSVVRGVEVHNSRAVEYVARENNLELELREVRPLPAHKRYLPPPGSSTTLRQISRRMRNEVVLQFRAS
jgi:hypothetical protein